MNEMIQLEDLQPEALGEVIRARAGEFDKATLRAVEHAWHAGRALLAAKKLIPHGQWGQWLSDNFEGRSQQTASNWMRLASNYQSAGNLESVKHGLLMLEESPEKQAKKAEREARKAEAPPKSLAPSTPAPPVSEGTIRHENPPLQPQRPAWLADPDELDRPEETDLPPLPRTNTHHTSANRRTPDARETDRAGIVCPDDPRGLQDGGWYMWSEQRNRLLPVTDEDVLRRFDQIRRERAPKAGQVMLVPASPPITSSVVESTKESASSKPGKAPTVQQLTTAVGDRVHDGDWQDLWRGKLEKAVEAWARYKQSLTGKAKVRSMESWEAALSRIENVAHDRGVDVVCDMIEKAIANGWQGWEHETNDRKSRGMAGGRVYAQLEKAEVKYDPLPE